MTDLSPREIKEVVLMRQKPAYLRGFDLSEIDLSGSGLLCGANLRNTIMKSVDLHGGRLCDADLREADLTGADLRDADLRGVKLHGADLTGAKLEGARFDRATRNEHTRFDDGALDSLDPAPELEEGNGDEPAGEEPEGPLLA